jgi:hypothetical protein
MTIRKILSRNKVLKRIYHNIKKKKRINSRYKFINRSKESKYLCIILAGYKENLWDIVFKRISRFMLKDIDVCIVSSGLYSKELDKLAEENNWSYLSVEKNNVCLVQNIAIKLHKNAEYIYKIDEDMFICDGFFETLKKTYDYILKNTRYKVGFVAPLIPINGYGYIRFLEKTNNIKEYEMKFEKAYYGSNSDEIIIKDSNVAKFIWEKTKNIDKIASEFLKEEISYSICPCRFSIGAILFNRQLWEEMGWFEVKSGNCMGLDEEQLCKYCMIKSKEIVVAENTLVGHFAFGPQNKDMNMYFEKNKDLFKIK